MKRNKRYALKFNTGDEVQIICTSDSTAQIKIAANKILRSGDSSTIDYLYVRDNFERLSYYYFDFQDF